MKKLFFNPKLTKLENFTTLYFIFIPLIVMIWKMGHVGYYPLLTLSDEYGGHLNSSMYEPVTWALLKGVGILVLSNILTAIVAVRYRLTLDTKLTKKVIIGLFIAGFFEFYYRGMSVFFNDTPFIDAYLQQILMTVVVGFLLQGIIFILFSLAVWKRAKKESQTPPAILTGSLEKQLEELETLKAKNLLSEEEYSSKRTAILS